MKSECDLLQYLLPSDVYVVDDSILFNTLLNVICDTSVVLLSSFGVVSVFEGFLVETSFAATKKNSNMKLHFKTVLLQIKKVKCLVHNLVKKILKT